MKSRWNKAPLAEKPLRCWCACLGYRGLAGLTLLSSLEGLFRSGSTAKMGWPPTFAGSVMLETDAWLFDSCPDLPKHPCKRIQPLQEDSTLIKRFFYFRIKDPYTFEKKILIFSRKKRYLEIVLWNADGNLLASDFPFVYTNILMYVHPPLSLHIFFYLIFLRCARFIHMCPSSLRAGRWVLR